MTKFLPDEVKLCAIRALQPLPSDIIRVVLENVEKMSRFPFHKKSLREELIRLDTKIQVSANVNYHNLYIYKNPIVLFRDEYDYLMLLDSIGTEPLHIWVVDDKNLKITSHAHRMSKEFVKRLT